MRPLPAFTLGLILTTLMACATSKESAPKGDAPMPDNHSAKAGHEHHDEAHSGHHDPLVHRFTAPEEYAERWDSPEREAWQRPMEIIQAMEILPGQTVADIGTGTGYFLPLLSAAVGDGGKVLALDIEEGMISYVKERAAREGLNPVDARVVALDDPQLPPGEVDRVIVVNTWHHIPGRADYASKIAQGLTADGSLYIVDFTLESSKGPPKEHRLSPEAVISELREAGLEGTLLDLDLPEQYVVKGTQPPSP